MKRYAITLAGCDDTTRFEVDLTDEQAEAVRMLAAKSEETSEFECMPVLRVVEA